MKVKNRWSEWLYLLLTLGSEDITFPSTYPSGCLLGCVEVSDCLSRDEYIDKVHRFTHTNNYIHNLYY